MGCRWGEDGSRQDPDGVQMVVQMGLDGGADGVQFCTDPFLGCLQTQWKIACCKQMHKLIMH